MFREESFYLKTWTLEKILLNSNDTCLTTQVLANMSQRWCCFWLLTLLWYDINIWIYIVMHKTTFWNPARFQESYQNPHIWESFLFSVEEYIYRERYRQYIYRLMPVYCGILPERACEWGQYQYFPTRGEYFTIRARTDLLYEYAMQ